MFNKFQSLFVVINDYCEQFDQTYVRGWEPEELSEEEIRQFAEFLLIPDPITPKEAAEWISTQLHSIKIELDSLIEFKKRYPDYDWSGWVEPYEQMAKKLTDLLYK